jgi:ABC-type transport system involved in cytochrome bd biosynthesis fused ATPase/permease subunit
MSRIPTNAEFDILEAKLDEAEKHLKNQKIPLISSLVALLVGLIFIVIFIFTDNQIFIWLYVTCSVIFVIEILRGKRFQRKFDKQMEEYQELRKKFEVE